MRMLAVVTNEDLVKAWCKKMAPPLVTLLGTEPEVQYVALRNINLIVQKRPSILANEVKVSRRKQQQQLQQQGGARFLDAALLARVRSGGPAPRPLCGASDGTRAGRRARAVRLPCGGPRPSAPVEQQQ